MNDKQILGKTEEVALPELGVGEIFARIDTGAKTSAVWASDVQETAEGLEVIFFGKGHASYSGKPMLFRSYSETVVASSNGAIERRYKIRVLIVIGGRRIRAWFTLADRSAQVYPILVGRNVLRGKFLVDVSLGTEALREQERHRTFILNQEIEKKQ